MYFSRKRKDADVKNSYGDSLEAFSGNALYYARGMPKMRKKSMYKTVSEVCAITGLTRKHLYYFHHEKVVEATAYANYSVEGNDGYKLYDDEAIEKLRKIALYYQLGLKRNEIRDIMLDNERDEEQIIERLISLEAEKKTKTERHITALEYLKRVGIKEYLKSTNVRISLDELGRELMSSSANSQKKMQCENTEKNGGNKQ